MIKISCGYIPPTKKCESKIKQMVPPNTKNDPPKVNEEVQTIIRVYPHVLEYNLTAHLSSERKCQTEIAIKPEQETKKFYSMLEYTPFQDIQETSIRTINLPRKARLQFNSASLSRLHIGNYLELDDDALSELCLDIRERIRAGLYKAPKSFVDKEIQTDLRVQPHILEDDKVASILEDATTQKV